MRFLVDAQLPPALARWLSAHVHEAEHVLDRHMETATDSAIWDFACQNDAVIVTKDEDFAQRKMLGPQVPSLFGSGYRTHGGVNCSRGSRRSCLIWCPLLSGAKRWLN